MTDDDDLRDRFGDELTEALRSRAQAATTLPPVDTVTVEHRIDRARGRRRLLAAVAAAVVGAGATAAIALHNHATARVNVATRSSSTSSAPPSLRPVTSGVADWTWVSADHGRRNRGEDAATAARALNAVLDSHD